MEFETIGPPIGFVHRGGGAAPTKTGTRKEEQRMFGSDEQGAIAQRIAAVPIAAKRRSYRRWLAITAG